MGEKRILIAGSIILVLGIANAALAKKPLDLPIVGGLAFILLLGGLAAFGAGPADLAGDFAMLALLTVVIAEAGPLLTVASHL